VTLSDIAALGEDRVGEFVNVSVDSAKCQGHARCNVVCPELFELDDEGAAFVVNPVVPDHLVARATQAVNNCPEAAIEMAQ
jgi:ferredoxin